MDCAFWCFWTIRNDKFCQSTQIRIAIITTLFQFNFNSKEIIDFGIEIPSGMQKNVTPYSVFPYISNLI